MLFRRLRFKAHMKTQQSESKMLKNFQKKFGSPQETIIYFGDWSTRGYTPKGQVTTKSIGFRSLFKKFGYTLYLVDEYKTSSICPKCRVDVKIRPFKTGPHPALHKRQQGIIATVHGLLRCQSESCQKEPKGNNGLHVDKPRLWNRDDVATLNIKYIVEQTLIDGNRPYPFRRGGQ